jgi:predicted flap endonuclease-1-like 5' DNA nuclease
MFEMNPLQLPNAVMQFWIMLLVSGALGFIIGYISRKATTRQLENQITATESQVVGCIKLRHMQQEEVVLQRISSRANELNFTRIGQATLLQADDLKEINGIGPFFERKLHSLRIYTFRQLANFTAEDAEQVANIIEFFPYRIEREDWIGQAKKLHRQKYGF